MLNLFMTVNGHILDAGCGSGRDSSYFLDKGFDVSAFDASAELAKLASQLIHRPVTVCQFNEYESDKPFDGIWACASLLHVSDR
jgi:trans-aconitate methyltransferase